MIRNCILHRLKNKKGYTLVEVMTVVIILAILAAVAVPSVFAFVETGKQMNRNNIARTLFLAAQSSLTNMKTNGQLSEFVNSASGAGILLDAPDEISISDGDDLNKDNIFSMVITRGDVTGTGKTLYDFLVGHISDQSPLEQSVCIEFNVKTGVVKSAFYSEDFGSSDLWSYDADATRLKDKGNLMERDSGALRDKKQGFYGVKTTSEVAPDTIPLKVFLRDASEDPFTDQFGIMYDKNLLYVEAYIPNVSGAAAREYTLEILDKSGDPFSTPIEIQSSALVEVFKLELAIPDAVQVGGKHIAFKDDASTSGMADYANYTRIIWVLDIVDENSTKYNNMKNSIGVKYKIEPQITYAKLTESVSGRNAVSDERHSHFASASSSILTGTRYGIKDTRHLNNIRYNLDKVGATYVQANNITVKDYDGKDVILAPLNVKFTDVNITSEEAFKSTFRGESKYIKNLKIHDSNMQNVGMFGIIDGGELSRVSVREALITSNVGGDVGALAGEVKNGGKISYSNAYANVRVTGGNESNNVGGLVGRLSDSTVERSFNGGFFDATERVSSNPKVGSIKSEKGGNIGGLVGFSQGSSKIQNSYNNARVNVESVTVEVDGPDRWLSMDPKFTTVSGVSILGGIAGNNEGTVKDTYFTNFVAIYEDGSSTSGAIVGKGKAAATSYFIESQSEFLGMNARSKEDLQTVFGGSFSATWQAGGGYAQGLETNTYYPYPQIKNNYQSHATTGIIPWEDIKDNTIPPNGRFGYYEWYTDDTWGYSLSTEAALATPGSMKIAKNEGYYIDFSYAGEFELTIKGTTWTLRDSRNNPANPGWVLSSGPNPDKFKLPIKFEEEIDGVKQTMYRLFLDNSIIEGLSPDGRSVNLVFKKVRGGIIVNEQFNPNFGNSVGYTGDHIVRSPRHFDNVDKILNGSYIQELNADYASYYRDINVNTSTNSVSIKSDTKITYPDGHAAVNGSFTGTYDGGNHYVKNIICSLGSFKEVGAAGNIKNLAILRSDIRNGTDAGAIAGKNAGTIEECEVSDAVIRATNNAGGVVGHNTGTVKNVYFNSTYRDATSGLFSTPILSGTNKGGLIGKNDGRLESAYSTAVGPDKKPTVGNGTPGIDVYYFFAIGYNEDVVAAPAQGTPKDAGALVKGHDGIFPGAEWENATADTTKDTILCTGAYPFPKIKDMHHYFDWPVLINSLRYYEEYNDGSFGYYYTSEKGIPVNTLKYDSERYVIEDGYLLDVTTDKHYDIVFGDATAPTITSRPGMVYDGRRVVKLTHAETEPLLTMDYIDVDGATPIKVTASVSGRPWENVLVGDSSYGNALTYFNPLFSKEAYLSKTTPAAVKTFDIRSPRQMKNISTSVQAKPLEVVVSYMGMTGIAQRNTYPYDGTVNPPDSGTPETGVVVSVTQISSAPIVYKRIVTITDPSKNYRLEELIQLTSGKWKAYNSTYYELQGKPAEVALNTSLYTYNQSISINFKDGNPTTEKVYRVYKGMDSASIPTYGALGKMDRNIVKNFSAREYNGQFQNKGGFTNQKNKDNKRYQSYKIMNLIMNVQDMGYSNNSAATFGDVSSSSAIKNLEFVDPQIRYTRNGMGGGIVANVNYGFIDNVNVYNQATSRSLFADANGSASNRFCADVTEISKVDGMTYSHVHGGIAGFTYGKDAVISNCIVGTNANNVEEIYNNKTKIICFSSTSTNNQPSIGVGGITGSMENGAKVIASTNISEIVPNTSQMSYGVSSFYSATHKAGGIVGNVSADGGNSCQIIGCYNAGTIKLEAGFVGGITGGIYGKSIGEPAKIVSCYNTGRINVEEDSTGKLIQTEPARYVSLRIGGIAGGTGAAEFLNCYNIGYLSGKVFLARPHMPGDGAGAIFGLADGADVIVENCVSLAADQYKPDTIVGKIFRNESTGARAGGRINGIEDDSVFNAAFSTYWETRANLRNNQVLISSNYIGESYPGLGNLGTGSKTYSVFTAPGNTFYIYPELWSFAYGGNNYSNPHITPWEYIDAHYDTTLKYYEKYAEDGKFASWYLDLKGNAQDNLSSDRTVAEDGYYLEVGIVGNYKVVINGVSTTAAAIADVYGTGSIGIPLNDDLLKHCGIGYNSIRVFTMLPETSAQNIEDNKVNRIIGTTTTDGSTVGMDIYFDPLFPKEIKFASATVDPKTLKYDSTLSMEEPYVIRSVRHLKSISKLTGVTSAAIIPPATTDPAITGTAIEINLTKDRLFQQEIDIDGSKYEKAFPGFNTTTKTFSGAVVAGDFQGIFEGTFDTNLDEYKVIKNIAINGAIDQSRIGLFAENSGSIGKVSLENFVIESRYEITSSALHIGTVASKNNGTIAHISVVNPTITGSSTGSAVHSINQYVGGIVGYNTTASSLISDVYLVSTATDSAITASGTGITTIGGIVGSNEGELDHVLYLAKAPGIGTNLHPIIGENSDVDHLNVNDAYYLGGVNFNEIVAVGTAGEPRTTSQLKELRNNLSGGWSNWGNSDPYPYPSLKSILPPSYYPTAEIDYILAYYEEYTDGSFGMLYFENASEISPKDTIDSAKTVRERGYCILLRNTYPYAVEMDGLWAIKLTDTGDDEILAMLNGFIMPHQYYFYIPNENPKDPGSLWSE